MSIILYSSLTEKPIFFVSDSAIEFVQYMNKEALKFYTKKQVYFLSQSFQGLSISPKVKVIQNKEFILRASYNFSILDEPLNSLYFSQLFLNISLPAARVEENLIISLCSKRNIIYQVNNDFYFKYLKNFCVNNNECFLSLIDILKYKNSVFR